MLGAIISDIAGFHLRGVFNTHLPFPLRSTIYGAPYHPNYQTVPFNFKKLLDFASFFNEPVRFS